MDSYNEKIMLTIREYIHGTLSETSTNLWFGEMELESLTQQEADFTVPSLIHKNIIDTQYAGLFRDAIKNVIGYLPAINVRVRESDTSFNRNEGNEAPAEPGYYNTGDGQASQAQRTQTTEQVTVLSHTRINQTYTFENYITGSSNKLAYAAALSVAEKPSDEYNPLFIYGPSGLGKTHLLYAITNRVLHNNPNAKIVYVKGEEFTNQMIESIRMGTNSDFRDKYRRADILLLDDIQFLSGREQTQVEFFNNFDALYEEGKQIILTSDRPPKDIKMLDERLRSRFEWGLIADIQPPNLELRVAILKDKATKLGLDIPDDLLTLLAEKLKDNVRQLEGALKRICAQNILEGKAFNRENCLQFIADMISSCEEPQVTPERILEVVSEHTNIAIEDIKSNKRTQAIAGARHICAYLLYKMSGMSQMQVAVYLGKKDHTTVTNSIQTVENEIKLNSSYESEINDIKKAIHKTEK